MIETDFWLTKDGQMVCMHGPYELNDVWGIKKSPENLTPEEIKNARLAKPEKYDKKYSDCRIPLIDDVFAIMPKDKRFELEVKGYGESFADKVEAARKKAGLDYWNIMVTSFEPSVIKDFKSKYPKYETALIVWLNPQKQSAEDIVALAKDAGASEESFLQGLYKVQSQKDCSGPPQPDKGQAHKRSHGKRVSVEHRKHSRYKRFIADHKRHARRACRLYRLHTQ